MHKFFECVVKILTLLQIQVIILKLSLCADQLWETCWQLYYFLKVYNLNYLLPLSFALSFLGQDSWHFPNIYTCVYTWPRLTGMWGRCYMWIMQLQCTQHTTNNKVLLWKKKAQKSTEYFRLTNLKSHNTCMMKATTLPSR